MRKWPAKKSPASSNLISTPKSKYYIIAPEMLYLYRVLLRIYREVVKKVRIFSKEVVRIAGRW